MSYVKFEKNLSPSEAKYKYVGLVKSVREEFPEKDHNFTLKFKNKKYKMRVNNKNCIMMTQIYHDYVFTENEKITFIKIDDNNFELTSNKSIS